MVGRRIVGPAGAWRRLLVRGLLSLFAMASCSCSQHYVRGQAAVEQGTAVQALQLNPADVAYQSSCLLTMTRKRGNLFFECVYVQTATDLHFLFFNEPQQRFEPALALPISELKRVAFRSNGLNSQIQLTHLERVLAFQLLANMHVTEEAYKSLVAAGVPEEEPGAWIDMQPTRGPTVTIPINAGR